MIEVPLESATGLDHWRASARALCAANVAPGKIDWRPPGSTASLLSGSGTGVGALEAIRPVRATRRFLDLAKRVLCHRDEERFARLYAILYKLQARPHLLTDRLDDDVSWALAAEKAIRRDVHKMHAFVRFRNAGEDSDGRENYAAWFEPTHNILTLGAPFFMRRFPNMSWVIVTPDGSASWNGQELVYGPPGTRNDVPAADAVEDQWRTYFKAIFNPARLKVSAMTSEMPKKYWANMPEAELIPDMIASAQARTGRMQAEAVTAPNILSQRLAQRREQAAEPASPPQTLEEARNAVSGCTRCPLYSGASQAVFGEGPEDARLMLVGEQPGDEEDIAGHPFIGPAGKVLDRALGQAGIIRKDVYVTNAVKHFKYQLRGKRRLHARPNAGEIDHCRWWLDLEREAVDPAVTVALGATAVRGLFRKTMKLADVRGRALELGNGRQAVVTVHPSYLLRLPDEGLRREQEAMFIEDLKLAASLQ